MTLSAGTKLGPYEILAPIGAGGMGEVFRARDPRLGREVAIKVLPASFSQDADRLKRFEQEARSASALNHPNIVTIHEIGSVNGTSYMAMELIEGASLRELLASGPLPAKRLLDVAVQIAEGLAKAHGAGIVHRDLKPENVMVTKDGFVKLLDFGLAKLFVAPEDRASGVATAIQQETTPGTVMGTVGYMSPEQASGRPVDFRSDQFAFGSILYEMATGQRAFQKGTGAQTLAAIIQDEPEPVAQINPRAPAPLRWIVERCLAKDPDERYVSTRDLARDLKSVREHLQEMTSSASGGTAVVEPARRRSWAAPLLIAGLVLAAVGGLFVGRRTAVVSQPTFQRLTFQRGTVYAARFGPDGQTVYYSAKWSGGEPRIYSLRPGIPESSPLSVPPAKLLALSSAGELAILVEPRPYRFTIPLGTLARVPLTGGVPKEVLQDVTEADWAPGGSDLAVVHHASGKDRLEYPIGKVLYETAGWIQDPRFSRDGRRIAFIDHPGADDGGGVAFVDLAGKKTDLVSGFATIQGLAWSADGREVWFTAARTGIQREIFAVDPSGRLRLVRTMQGTPALLDLAASSALVTEDDYRSGTFVFLQGQNDPKDLGWFDWTSDRGLTPDGQQFLFDESGEGGGPNGSVYLRPTDGSAAVRLGDGTAQALSPDGTYALTRTTSEPQHFVVVPVKAGQPHVFPPDSFGQVTYGAFFPDGFRFAFEAHAPGHGGRLYVQALSGGPATPVSAEGINSGRLFVSPDARWIAALGPDRRIHLYPTGGGSPTELPSSKAGDNPSGWTADGRGIYVSGGGIPCRIDVIDIATGARTHVRDLVPADDAGMNSRGATRVTPDGRTMTLGFNRILSTLYWIRDLK
ncbi:MAG TPA: protein kinase [Thermoanaerobaculia bacterium]|nr:protein kinase [Thermoanaerobaculia bacterium]